MSLERKKGEQMARIDGFGIGIRFYSTVTVKQIDWLWQPYIPYGKVTVIQGDPGDGKTTLILSIAAMLSTGQAMPESLQAPACSNVIYQSAEDGAEDTIKPRLIAAGADCEKVAFIDETNEFLTLDSPRIEQAIRDADAKLLVIDPLQAYLGDGSEMNRAEGVRPLMRSLTNVAERTGCAIVIIGHMNKGSGTKGIYRGLGSIDISASARSVLLVARLRDNPEVRVLAQIKNSLAREGPALAFEIRHGTGIHWLGEYEISAAELLTGKTPDNSGKSTLAASILLSVLGEGPMTSCEIYEKMQAQDISKRTADAAKKKLAVHSKKIGDTWYWSL